MKKSENIREKILNQSSYWVESINGYLYDAIINYKESHKMKQVDLAKHLGISASRVSQILNDGEINYSLDKLIQFAIKVDFYPDFKFIDKKSFLEREEKYRKTTSLSIAYNPMDIWEIKQSPKKKDKGTITFTPRTSVKHQEAL